MAVPGRKVELHSLKARPELNGKIAIVTAWEHPTDNTRVPVDVDGQMIGVKLANLTWLPNEGMENAVLGQGGILPVEEGKCLCDLLHIARFSANRNACIPGVADIQDCARLHASGAQGLRALMLLNAKMYSFWTHPPPRYPDSVLQNLRDTTDQQCFANKPNIPPELSLMRNRAYDREVASWGTARISEKFWIVEHRDDGAVLVAADRPSLVCIALGQATAIGLL
ncbi:hypothetical protein T484DRAFT_1800139, partial [Baffinella frigidus]